MHAYNVLNNKKKWQESLSSLITDPAELIQLLELDPDLLPAAKKACEVFPLRVPRGFAARMERGNPNDPLLKQVLPLGVELIPTPGYVKDPLGELAANPVPGLLHKYPGRVLVTPTSACAIHCRYCFRRHFPYADNNPGRAGWGKIMEYIQADETIREVLISGGDPLSMNDKMLREFIDMLSDISHVNRVRFHTRLPIVMPERITDEFLEIMDDTSLQVVMVVHVNHPHEIDEEVEQMLQKVKSTDTALFNQSVLLKGVNDDSKTLAVLSEVLFAAGVVPYYLHLLDKIDGAAHFDVDLATAQQIHTEMAQVLPGYLVPKLMRETAGELSKTDLSTAIYTV